MRKLLCALSLLTSTAFADGLNFTPSVATLREAVPVAVPATSGTMALTKANVVVLRGDVDDDTVSHVILKLSTTTSKEPILFITSGGGSVMAGLSLIQYILASPKPITCVVDVAASMAFSILQSCHKRYALPMGILMQHQASWSVHGPHKQNLAYIAFLSSWLEKLSQSEASRIGMDLEVYKTKVDHDWWMNGVDAKAANVVDDVKLLTCDAALSQETVTEKYMTIFGAVKITWAGCPLAKAPLSVKWEKHMTDTEKAELLKEIMNTDQRASRNLILSREIITNID